MTSVVDRLKAMDCDCNDDFVCVPCEAVNEIERLEKEVGHWQGLYGRAAEMYNKEVKYSEGSEATKKGLFERIFK